MLVTMPLDELLGLELELDVVVALDELDEPLSEIVVESRAAPTVKSASTVVAIEPLRAVEVR
jgi:hypothetical protein